MITILQNGRGLKTPQKYYSIHWQPLYILRLQNNIISNLFQAHKEQRRFSLIKLWELVVIFQQTCCNYLIQNCLKYSSSIYCTPHMFCPKRLHQDSSIRDLQESIVKALRMVIRKKSSKIAIK